MYEDRQGATVDIRRWVVWILVAILLISALLSFINYQIVRSGSTWSGFLVPWNAVNRWLVEGENPYSDSVRINAQEMIYNRPAVVSSGEEGCQLIIPVPSLLLLLPFGLLPYEIARTAWMTLTEISLILLVFLGLGLENRKPRLIILLPLIAFALLWFPSLQAVVNADLRVFFIMLQILTLWVFLKRRDVLSGILAFISYSGPGLLLPLLIFILIRSLRERRWSFMTSWIGSSLLLIILSLRIIPQWPVDWLRELLRWMIEVQGFSWPVDVEEYFNPLPFAFPVSVALMGLALVYLLMEWQISKKRSETWQLWTAGLTIVLSLILVVFPSLTNQVALIPVLILVFLGWSARWGKKTIWLIYSVLIIYLGFSWGWYYAGLQESMSALYFVPVIFLLIALWWNRWWNIRDGLSLPMDYLNLPEE